MDNNKIGNFIASHRKQKNLTQRELGDKLFVTDKAVSKWERGLSLPDITILEKLVKELDTDIYSILQIDKIDSDDANKILQNEIVKIKRQIHKKIISIILPMIVLIGTIVFKLAPFGYNVIHTRYLHNVNKSVSLGIPIVDKYNYDLDTDYSTRYDENDDYLVPENEDVLYEKKFDNTILRFGKVDNVLGQNILVNVLRSTDDGKNFFVVSDDVIKVSNRSKFIFLDENLGFVLSTEKIFLDNSNNGLYVTSDSGKSFFSPNFKYTNEKVEFINIEGLPYYEEGVLKVKCSVEQISLKEDGYEERELIFISRDNGMNWILEDN